LFRKRKSGNMMKRFCIVFALFSFWVNLETRVPGQESARTVLFDGSSLDAWQGYQSAEIPDGWEIVDGTMHGSGGGGDIMTKDQYADFDLQLQWKISKGGNSGIIYRVRQGDQASYFSGPEYQILDDVSAADKDDTDKDDTDKDDTDKVDTDKVDTDKVDTDKVDADKVDERHVAGALYGLYAGSQEAAKPAGEWNSARIRIQDNHIAHWLNGKRIVECQLGDEDWNQRVADSKFSAWKQFGKSAKGHIVLQDHGNPVWYRNISIISFDHSEKRHGDN
jgi:hypothetical protein